MFDFDQTQLFSKNESILMDIGLRNIYVACKGILLGWINFSAIQLTFYKYISFNDESSHEWIPIKGNSSCLIIIPETV